MPIFGITAASIQDNLGGAFESIATQTVGVGGSATITFSSIPQTYKHLQIRLVCRDNQANGVGNNSFTTFNGDTAANYNWHIFYGDGATPLITGFATQTSMRIFNGLGSTQANTFGTAVIDIPDYTSTTKNKTVNSIAGYDLNGSGNIQQWSGSWMNSTIAAITSITFTATGLFTQNSSFALYGIRG